MEQGRNKILGVNLGIFAAYTLLSFLIGFRDGSGGLYHAFFIVSHVIISFFIGFIKLTARDKNENAGVHILSAVLILIIGFGTCVGLSELTGFLTHGRLNL
jgi:hypothetical protein